MPGQYKELLSICDAIDEIVYVSDPVTYEMLYINRVLREELGDVKGRKCFQAFQGLEEPCPFCTNPEIFGVNEGKTHVWEFQNRRNGRWYHCVDRAFEWPDGRKVRSEMAIDITERKRMEASLRESEATARALLNMEVVSVLLLDRDEVCIDANETLAKRFDMTVAEIRGKSHRDFLPPEVAARRHVYFMEALRTKRLVRFEDERQGRWLDISYSPVLDEQGEVIKVAVMAFDITDRVFMERRLRQAHKMEAMGSLAAGVAHDFNNLLTTVMGGVQAAMHRLDSSHAAQASLRNAQQACQRGAELVRQILTFGQPADEPEIPVRLQSVLESGLALQQQTMPASINVTCHIDASCGPIMASDIQLYQLVSNLIANARQAMANKGGTLTIRLEEVSVSKGQGVNETMALSSGQYARLIVADTGIGMDQATTERIFEPFFSTKGGGLGLAICQKIVSYLGGAIGVTSSPDRGTSFEVLLPVVEAAVETTEDEAVAPSLPKRSCRILFVDDERINLQTWRIALRQEGFTVAIADSGQEALDLFRADPDGFDVVITDQRMPDMKGSDLARELCALRPGIPIILASGWNDIRSQEEVRAVGIKKVVNKPHSLEDLLAAIAQVTSG